VTKKIVPPSLLPSHSPSLATSTKKREKNEEGYNKLDKIWSTKDNQNKQ
jgi:hypothetical protein